MEPFPPPLSFLPARWSLDCDRRALSVTAVTIPSARGILRWPDPTITVFHAPRVKTRYFLGGRGRYGALGTVRAMEGCTRHEAGRADRRSVDRTGPGVRFDRDQRDRRGFAAREFGVSLRCAAGPARRRSGVHRRRRHRRGHRRPDTVRRAGPVAGARGDRDRAGRGCRPGAAGGALLGKAQRRVTPGRRHRHQRQDHGQPHDPPRSGHRRPPVRADWNDPRR